MTNQDETDRTKAIMRAIAADPELSAFIDTGLKSPRPFGDGENVRLIILGQDPTVKNPASRANVHVVLNLNRNGSLRTYLKQVCTGLGLNIDQHVFATNLFKNFFVSPPASYPPDRLRRIANYWMPLLLEELARYPNAPILTLGEPVLGLVAKPHAKRKVREYWGYATREADGTAKTGFRCLAPSENLLGRFVYPMPHQPSVSKPFYRGTMQHYISYIKSSAEPAESLSDS